MRVPALLVALLVAATPAAAEDPSGNYGVNHLAIPIVVPAGKQNARAEAELGPELALRYSTSAGNGPAGVGWGVSYSSITLDAREGVPDWWVPFVLDCSDEWVGRLRLDGMELVPSPSDPVYQPLGFAYACGFRTRPDTQVFVVPVWGSSVPVDGGMPPAFLLVKPDGTLWWYGDEPDAGETLYRRTNGSSFSADRLVTTEWHLQYVQDRDGNQVRYWSDVGHGPEGHGPRGALRAITWAERVLRNEGERRDEEEHRRGEERRREGSRPPHGGGSGGAKRHLARKGEDRGDAHDHAAADLGDVVFEAAPGTPAPEPPGLPPYPGPDAVSGLDDILHWPAAHFPRPRPHYYAVELVYEDRDDVIRSHAAGDDRVFDRRIHQITTLADAQVWRDASGEVHVDAMLGPASYLRSWVLQYDTGSTRRSRLRRVWQLPGFDPTGLYGGAITPLGDDSWASDPDGSTAWTGYFLSDVTAGPGTVRVTRDAAGQSSSHVVTMDGPFLKTTIRHGAELVEHAGLPAVGLDFTLVVPARPTLVTEEHRDVLGRTHRTWRTGQDPNEGTEFLLDGYSLLHEYDDPDRGLWTFRYDPHGRPTQRRLEQRHAPGPQVETWWRYDPAGQLRVEHSFGDVGYERWDYEHGVSHPSQNPSGGPAAGGHAQKMTRASYRTASPMAQPVPAVEVTYRYDRLGRVVEEQQWFDNGDPVSPDPLPSGRDPIGLLFAEYGHYTDGEVRQIRLPESPSLTGVGGELVSYGRGDAGKLVSMAGDETYVAGTRHNVLGKVAASSLAGDVEERYGYDLGAGGDQRIVEATTTYGPWGSTGLDRSYVWDDLGNLVHWEDEAPGLGLDGLPETVDCDYDGISALVGCTYRDTQSGDVEAAITYAYDALGNRLEELAEYPASGESRHSWQLHAGDRSLLASVGGYTAPMNAPVLRVERQDGLLMPASEQSFDARGHLVSQRYRTVTDSAPYSFSEHGLGGTPGFLAADRHLVWDNRGRFRGAYTTDTTGGVPSREVQSELVYDHDGRRVAKRGRALGLGLGSSNSRRFGSLFELTSRTTEDSYTLYYRFGGRLVAQRDVTLSPQEPPVETGNELRVMSGDHLGSTSLVVDADTGLLDRAVRYEPYGRIREQWGTQSVSDETAPGAVDELFHGKRRELAALGHGGTDFELETYDYGARLYAPTFGTFISADPITPDVAWEANAYQYARSNPLRYRDPTGHGSEVVHAALAAEHPKDDLPAGWTRRRHGKARWAFDPVGNPHVWDWGGAKGWVIERGWHEKSQAVYEESAKLSTTWAFFATVIETPTWFLGAGTKALGATGAGKAGLFRGGLTRLKAFFLGDCNPHRARARLRAAMGLKGKGGQFDHFVLQWRWVRHGPQWLRRLANGEWNLLYLTGKVFTHKGTPMNVNAFMGLAPYWHRADQARRALGFRLLTTGGTLTAASGAAIQGYRTGRFFLDVDPTTTKPDE